MNVTFDESQLFQNNYFEKIENKDAMFDIYYSGSIIIVFLKSEI